MSIALIRPNKRLFHYRLVNSIQVSCFSDGSGQDRNSEVKGAMFDFLKDLTDNKNSSGPNTSDKWSQFRANMENLSTFSGVAQRATPNSRQRVFRTDANFARKFPNGPQGSAPPATNAAKPRRNFDQDESGGFSVPQGEDGEDEERSDSLPPEVLSEFDSLDHFAESVAKGQFQFLPPGTKSKEEEFDEMDRLLTNALIGACKTSDHSYIELFRPNIKRVPEDKMRLPQPRSMGQLVQAMQPNIQGAEKDTYAYESGLQVWNMVSRNLWYTEQEKRYFANTTARHVSELMSDLEKLEAREKEVPTPIFEPNMEFKAVDDDFHGGDDEDGDQDHDNDDREHDMDGNGSADKLSVLPTMYEKASTEKDFDDLIWRDPIFDPKFRKGLNGMLAEIEAKKRRERVQVKAKKQLATDWSQQAVLSEDDL